MEVFEQIYIEYSERIYHFLYKLCRNESEAEELTQETFFRAFRSFDKFRGDSSIFTWLAAIAKNTYYHYNKKHHQTLDSIDLESVVDAYCAQEDLVEEVVMRNEVLGRVRELLHELPNKYRDVVMLRIYADMSFKQVAETLHITENSAKVIYYRAKNMLKERINP